MSCINNVPSWARPAVDAFKSTGHLSGDGVQHQAIPANQVPQVESQLTQRLDQLIAADESPIDQAKNQPGKVTVEQAGIKVNDNFEGNTQKGCLELNASGQITTAAFGEFSDKAAVLVQAPDNGDGTQAAVGVHIDRSASGNSYVEMQGMPTNGFMFA